MILPGGTIGILRWWTTRTNAHSSRSSDGLSFHIFCPEAGSTAGRIADTFTQANYDDFEALERFASSVDCITFDLKTFPLIL